MLYQVKLQINVTPRNLELDFLWGNIVEELNIIHCRVLSGGQLSKYASISKGFHQYSGRCLVDICNINIIVWCFKN